MTPLPHELPFVVDVPETGSVHRHGGFDLYRPDGLDGPAPVVVFVPGPVPAELPVPPREWPLFQGYGRVVAGRGVLAAVLDLPYHSLPDVPAVRGEFAARVESVRTLPEVDSARVAVWAFSGGGLLVKHWLAESPEWLRCLGLTYPVLGTDEDDHVSQPHDGLPVVLTRAGLEDPRYQSFVDEIADAVRRVDVPDGRHGFDIADHTDQSRRAVLDAVELVVGSVREQFAAPSWFTGIAAALIDGLPPAEATRWARRVHSVLADSGGTVPFSVVHAWHRDTVAPLLGEPGVALGALHARAFAGETIGEAEWHEALRPALAAVYRRAYDYEKAHATASATATAYAAANDFGPDETTQFVEHYATLNTDANVEAFAEANAIANARALAAAYATADADAYAAAFPAAYARACAIASGAEDAYRSLADGLVSRL
ncbi:hypothetical protein [Amycolatopsis sp. CA-230715]|uniref:hypothetical protein n=1 Tax=Amycolatopsis sp. CA-230715 TaxID=2745196 RepID=UPI001C01AF7E|nr:hypothetical protein [Amycolatopsis sp. CA-230715]QWF85145.1 hypothetical protein HUW46_08599 [Amycolatopsis sp. CA-230715]